ncbi:MAG: radical SAM protein [Bacteroidales bacterium]|nr:radical SAM protein [Bacteroidales bacterium]
MSNNTLNALPRNLYPVLDPSVKLHCAPTLGFLSSDSRVVPSHVPSGIARILSRCDGTRTFGQILEEYIRGEHSGETDTDRMETLVHLAWYIRDELITLNETATKVTPNTTGSFDLFYPTSLQVELTTKCNLNCSYCYRNAGPGADHLTTDTQQLLSTLSSLAQNGLQSVELTGGEPMMHPDFDEIAAFCCEQLALVGILTNGTLLTSQRLEKLKPYREKLIFSISLDSHIASEHNRRRGGKNAFERTTEGIRLLKKEGFLTRVSMSVDESNWSHLEPTLLLARELGADLFTYSPILPFGRAGTAFKRWNHNAREVLETEQKLQEQYSDFLHLFSEGTLTKVSQPGGCGAGWRVYAMDPDGNVRPCVTFDEDQGIFGSLYNQDEKEVFGSGLARSFSRLSPPEPGICQSCPWAAFCQHCSLRGAIAAQWIGEENCRWLQQEESARWYEQIKTDFLRYRSPEKVR